MQYFFDKYHKSDDGRLAVLPKDVIPSEPCSLTDICDWLENNGWISKVVKNESGFFWFYVSPAGLVND